MVFIISNEPRQQLIFIYTFQFNDNIITCGECFCFVEEAVVPWCPIFFSLPDKFCRVHGHLAGSCISQPPLQLDLALGSSSFQWCLLAISFSSLSLGWNADMLFWRRTNFDYVLKFGFLDKRLSNKIEGTWVSEWLNGAKLPIHPRWLLQREIKK